MKYNNDVKDNITTNNYTDNKVILNMVDYNLSDFPGPEAISNSWLSISIKHSFLFHFFSKTMHIQGIVPSEWKHKKHAVYRQLGFYKSRLYNYVKFSNISIVNVF